MEMYMEMIDRMLDNLDESDALFVQQIYTILVKHEERKRGELNG